MNPSTLATSTCDCAWRNRAAAVAWCSRNACRSARSILANRRNHRVTHQSAAPPGAGWGRSPGGTGRKRIAEENRDVAREKAQLLEALTLRRSIEQPVEVAVQSQDVALGGLIGAAVLLRGR